MIQNKMSSQQPLAIFLCGFLAGCVSFLMIVSLPDMSKVIKIEDTIKVMPNIVKVTENATVTSPVYNAGNDSHMHIDDTEVADRLHTDVKVLCWIMTYKNNLNTKAEIVRKTWGQRCNILLFAADEEHKDFPTIPIQVPGAGRDFLSHKTFAALQYIHDNYLENADWFLKADDDTYVILENLRYLLMDHFPDEPIFFGHHFKTLVKQGYMSGGAGYVMSREALRRYGQRDQTSPLCKPQKGYPEDSAFGRCMSYLEVKPCDSRDSLNRTRFHALSANDVIQGRYPMWYYDYDKYGATKGEGSISDYAVSFHYIRPEQMQLIDLLVYHTRPYGIVSGPQQLNKHSTCFHH